MLEDIIFNMLIAGLVLIIPTAVTWFIIYGIKLSMILIKKEDDTKKEYMLLKEGKKDIREDDSFFEEIDSKETFQEDQVLCKVGAKNDSEPIRREINLDVISKNFNSGDTVNLKALKEKGLVPPNTEYVKILASGRLTKSLTVEAQDFSNTAIEMLRLSGGKAIKK